MILIVDDDVQVRDLLARILAARDHECATAGSVDEARAVIAGITPGSRVVMVGAGFIAFTILNAILARGASLTIVEVAPRILPRMVDATCAGIVEGWLAKNRVAARTGATLTSIEQVKGHYAAEFQDGWRVAYLRKNGM